MRERAVGEEPQSEAPRVAGRRQRAQRARRVFGGARRRGARRRCAGRSRGRERPRENGRGERADDRQRGARPPFERALVHRRRSPSVLRRRLPSAPLALDPRRDYAEIAMSSPFGFLLSPDPPSRRAGVVVAAVLVALCTLLVYPLKHIAPAASLSVVYLPAVLVVSTIW